MKKIICLLIIATMLVCPLSAYAEGASPAPRIYASNTTVTAGSTTYITVYASDFDDVGAIEMFAFYDPEVFTVTSSQAQSLVSGQQTVIDTSTPGEASFNMLSAQGVSGSGAVWRIGFQAKSSSAEGSYDIVLAVGNAYQTSLDPVSIGVTSPKVTVNAPTVSKKTLSFYASGSSGTLYQGDSVAVGFSTNNAQGMTSAEFEFEYDASKLEFESLELGAKLTSAQNALYSVNTDIPGYIKVSYASTSEVTGSLYPMITVNFTVIAEEAGNTDVSLKLSGLYDLSLTSINGGTVTRTLNIAQNVVAPDLPKITVSGFDGAEETFDIVMTAPGASALAAGDFEIRFDATRINCTAAVCETEGCFVISNIDNENGLIKFSFICEDGIAEDTELIKLSFSREGLLGGAVTLSVFGKNTVDANYNRISFDYESPTLRCHVLGADATCTAPQSCTVCNKEFSAALGHDEVSHEAQAATCVEYGWNAYMTCSRCDYTTYEEIAATGHSFGDWVTTKEPTESKNGEKRRDCANCDAYETSPIAALNHSHENWEEIILESVAPTCTETGLTEGKKCSGCGEIIEPQEVIPALGHAFGEWVQTVAPSVGTKGKERRECANCDHYETREVEIGSAQKFKDELSAISKDTATYAQLYSALKTYATLSETEKASVSAEYGVLRQLISDYNAKAKIANEELANATEIAFATLVPMGLTFLAALWFLLRKKFLI